MTTLAATVQTAMAPAARYVALLARGSSSTAELLARPDVEAVLSDALSEASAAAHAAVLEAWGKSGGVDETVIAHLVRDIDRQFTALPHLRNLIREAHGDGEQAVRSAIVRFSKEVALRASLTEAMAHGAGRTSATIAAGQEAAAQGHVVWKRWRSARTPTTCRWCLALDGTAIPLGADFRKYLGPPVDLSGKGVLTHPPKPWHGKLMGPLLHPHCRCTIELVTGAAPVQVSQTVVIQRGFIAASSIREMPEQQYQSMIHFMAAAIHELGQVLRRLASHGRVP